MYLHSLILTHYVAYSNIKLRKREIEEKYDISVQYNVVVVEGQGGIFDLDVGHIVGPLNY